MSEHASLRHHHGLDKMYQKLKKKHSPSGRSPGIESSSLRLGFASVLDIRKLRGILSIVKKRRHYKPQISIALISRLLD